MDTATSLTLDPIVSEFETAEQEAAHTAWIRAELARRRDDPRPGIPHDEVFRRIDALIARLQQQRQKTA